MTQEPTTQQEMTCSNCGANLRIVWKARQGAVGSLEGYWVKCPKCFAELSLPDQPLRLFHQEGDHWIEATV